VDPAATAGLRGQRPDVKGFHRVEYVDAVV